MIQKEDIEKVQSKITEEIHADSVFRDIEARVKERSKYEKRWFWELLQNAKDSITKSEKIRVRIDISDSEISFSHSGNPFELRDILSLIIQGSSKDDREEKIGRFGTGFMTTYLLSKEVEISGALTDNQGFFQFLLNRNAITKDDFRILQVQSNEQFKNSISVDSYLGTTKFQTRFTYKNIDKESETVRTGLSCLDELIPITQLFNEQIESVEVSENGDTKTYLKEFKKGYAINSCKVTEWAIETKLNDKPLHALKAYIVNADDWDTCILTRLIEGTETILPLTNNFPRLFFTFPLIGTEEIGIPLIINSSKLDPRIERDGVYLKNTAENNDEQNKIVLAEAITKSIRIYADLFQQKDIKGIFELFGFKIAKDYEWMDHEWFDNLRRDTITEISSLPIIIPSDNKELRISLNDIIIPYAKDVERRFLLWKLISRIKDKYVPQLEELEEWVSISENIASLAKGHAEVYQLQYVWNIHKLIGLIEGSSGKSDLEQILSDNTTTWLSDFYSTIENILGAFPLNNKIVLNQEDKLRKAEGIFWDKFHDDELIAISKLIDLNFSWDLISRDIADFEIPGVERFDLQQAVSKLKSTLNDFDDSHFVNVEHIKCSARFLKWLIAKGNKEVVKDLKILTGANKKNEEEFTYDYFPKSDHLLLSPKPFFENEFPLYTSLIRGRDYMHETYNDFLTPADYNYLDECGLIHVKPLLIKTEFATLNTLELLVKSEVDLNLLRDNEGQLKFKFKISYVDFAFLTTTSGNIYDRNKTQKSSLERFRFLLREAVEKDPMFESNTQIVHVEGLEKPLELYKCLWIYRAKRNNWINIKSEGENSETRFISETPSSKNLSQLLKDDESLIKEIRGAKQQVFLNRLGVGVSDLIRNTLSSDDLRLSWDKAITNMITSDADPELVQEIFNDPNIKAEYQNRLKQRKLIDRNQRIGKLIEELFKKYVEQLKAEGYSINIEREPFGSDYIITEESSDFVENDKRQGFKVGDWLIELKATGKSYAAMTPLQAKTATEPDKMGTYALVVVPLDGADPDIEYVKNNARVINNIGQKIQEIIGDFDEIELRKLDLNQGKNGISVNIEEQNIRFKVDSSIWQTEQVTIESFVINSFKRKTN